MENTKSDYEIALERLEKSPLKKFMEKNTIPEETQTINKDISYET